MVSNARHPGERDGNDFLCLIFIKLVHYQRIKRIGSASRIGGL
jgi:hypothetical protein